MASKLTKNLLPQTIDCDDPWGIGFRVKIRRSGHGKALSNSGQTVSDRIELARAYGDAQERFKALGREAPTDMGRMAIADPAFAAALGSILTASKEFQVVSYVAGWGNSDGAEEPFFDKLRLPQGGAFSRQDVIDKFLSAFGDDDDEEVFEIPPFMLADKSDFVYNVELMREASEIVIGYLDKVGRVSTKTKSEEPSKTKSEEPFEEGSEELTKEGSEEPTNMGSEEPTKEGSEGEESDDSDNQPAGEESLKDHLERLADERDSKLLELGVIRSPYAGQTLRSAVISWIDDEASKLQAKYAGRKPFLPATSK